MSSARIRPVVFVFVSVALALAGLILPAPARAAATTTTTHIFLPIDQDFINFCNGETVHTTGTFHIVIHVTSDGNGGYHFAAGGNAQGLVGVSDSGTRYRFAGVLRQEENTSGPPPWEFTYLDIFNVVSEGSTANFIYRIVTHFTINAEGVPTATIDEVRWECQG